MSDRSSCEIFGEVFGFLAEEPTEEVKRCARRIYDRTWKYDFIQDEMGADAALIKLGLAKRGSKEDGVLYLSQDGKTWEV